MKISKRLALLLCVFTAIILVTSPAMAGWGAGWGTGSVVSSGTVTGLASAKATGARVVATIGTYGSPLINHHFISAALIPGVVWCGNPGNGNPSPAAQPVVLRSTFSATQFIPAGQIDASGTAAFYLHAEASEAQMNSAINADDACPGGNRNHHSRWTLLDFVPQQFAGLLQGYDTSGKLLTQSVYDCQMSWSTLIHLGYRQQTSYTCRERPDQRIN